MKPQFQQVLETAQAASLGPEVRPSRKSIAELDKILALQFATTKLEPDRKDCIRALALLWHDHLNEAHELAQNIHDPDGSLIHAIMHRREPDFGNAKYWFHRVGRHDSYSEIARRVAELPSSADEGELLERICPNHEWDPFAFVDAVQRSREGMAMIPFLQRLQGVEFSAIFDNLAARPTA
jgi:hypothetical protein